MAADQLAQAPLERPVVERPGDPQGRGDVEGGLPGRELIEEPQGLLGEGERLRAGVCAGLDRPGLATGAAATNRLDPLGEPPDGGSLKDRPQRELDAQHVAQTRDDLSREERVATDVEEAV